MCNSKFVIGKQRILEVKNICKTYRPKKGAETKALDDVSVSFPETGMVFLLGKSGSGKSTLLNICGGLDRADSGEIIIKGKSSKDFTPTDFDSCRNTLVGFVFQEYNILSEFTVEDNIALALELQNKKRDEKRIAEILKNVDLEEFAKRKPNTLSGGQKQRVAIARALVKEPQIILADEPTGALDSQTGRQVLDTLKKLSAHTLVIVVSHDREFAENYADRIIELKDGKIIADRTREGDAAQLKNVQFIGNDTIAVRDGSALTDCIFIIRDDDSTVSIANVVVGEILGASAIIQGIQYLTLGVGLGFTVFAMLLMFNFISASITAKKKEIGILRAIGARSTDVFKIFWSEALIVAGACLVLSVIVCVALCPVINAAIIDNTALNVSLLLFTPLSFLFMTAVALVTATLSTLLPVSLYAKKPPVESIRAL